MAIYLITGSDDRLISVQLTELVDQLIGSADRASMFESHDVEAPTADDRELAIRNAVMGAETPSLFGDTRVVVLRGIHEATVDQLAPLVRYLRDPPEITHLVMTASGKLAKSTMDALSKSGATIIATAPPARRSELVVWFQEQFTQAGMKLDAEAMNSVIDWLGQDQARLPALIEVLVSAFGTSKKLLADDIQPFLGEKGSVLPWDLTDAIDRADASTALAMLRRMVRSGEYHPLQVMSLLHNHYVRLLKLDGPDVLDSQQAMTLIGSKSEFQGRKYLDLYHRVGSSGVSGAIQLLSRADIDLRGGKDLPEELTMEILVARLSKMGGPAPRTSRKR
ncbi:MAG: DNA polymerase III subunit delta [Actinomycetota bacterium]